MSLRLYCYLCGKPVLVQFDRDGQLDLTPSCCCSPMSTMIALPDSYEWAKPPSEAQMAAIRKAVDQAVREVKR